MSPAAPNHPMQRRRASRLRQLQFEGRRRLARSADGGCSPKTTTRMRTLKSICIAVAAAAALASGCGTAGRSRAPFYPGLYPGSRFDVDFIAHHHEKDMGEVWPLFVLDFPISAAVDTLLLPWDIAHLPRETSTTNSVPR